jgi:mannose-6-phosphate isomerase-like protein (cupin superfamily)
MPRNYRRIVTGHDANGRSILWKDGPSPNAVEVMPGLVSHEMWQTTAPAGNTGDEDTALGPLQLEPRNANGTVFRIVTFPPDESLKDADMGEAFEKMHSDAHDADSDTAGMHETRTTDYAIVIEGEVWAVMEEGETKMEVGDVLIQRGTNHAWSNRSDKPAAVAFVLIDAKARG